MTETPELSIYEKAFTKSDKTDAILVVDGMKLHVNKALLSYHSDFFNVLFNSEFMEKSMEEIEIKDVNFENFAIVLSLVHNAPIKYTKEQVESLLEIADRFQLSAVTRHLELFAETTDIGFSTLVEIADKYQLNDLMDVLLSRRKVKKYYCRDELGRRSPNMELLDKLSKETKIKIFHRILEIDNRSGLPPNNESPIEYEENFLKSDKTDAVLAIEGRKLHVNKAVLSHHSDYINTLFNSDFEEKSTEEMEIKGVNFEDFATLLSFIQLKAIKPTKENVENVLELADRFEIPCVKFYLEPLIIHFAFSEFDDIRIGDKYGMNDLVKKGIKDLDKEDYKKLSAEPFYEGLSNDTKIELFYKYLKL